MRARSVHTSGVLTAALLLSAAAVAPSAGAAARETADDGGAQQCIVNAVSGSESCYRTFTEAIEAASGGRITGAPLSATEAARSDAFGARMADQAQGEVIQGTFFEDEQYGGASLTIWGAEPCVKDGWVNFQFDLDDDWKNRISSLQPWGGCALWLYPEPGLNGDRDGPFEENSAAVGSFMNDRTQSIGFS
uniref:Peptidase inhibitor family I36 protein n=1 Tax=Streptomyces sp. NBC_01401 TaxID=2903854 RepID=A0AAU3GPM6_9ACTN